MSSKKKIILISSIAGAVLLLAAIITTVCLIRKRIADRTVRVAFYGLSEEICTVLQEQMPKEDKIKLQFDLIPDSDFDPAVISKKYDMLFTWKGEVTDFLADSAQLIPEKILNSMPYSLRNKKCVPVLLDHCELAFRKDLLGKEEPPYSFKDFETYLNSAKNKVFSPFFCTGADDRILIDLVGALVEARGGLKAYKTLIQELRSAESLEDVLDKDLDGITLREILDMLADWPDQGLTHPSWYNGVSDDLIFFADNKQLGVFFTLLSEHRNIQYNVIKNFKASLMPPDVSASNYGIIAPSVSVMLLSDNGNNRRFLSEYFSLDAQQILSDKTKLAPVHYQAQAYDKLSDDVRYWAASCAGGAQPDLYYAVYQRKSKELEKICSEIRDYVR